LIYRSQDRPNRFLQKRRRSSDEEQYALFTSFDFEAPFACPFHNQPAEPAAMKHETNKASQHKATTTMHATTTKTIICSGHANTP
jgi:hypothetical protein